MEQEVPKRPAWLKADNSYDLLIPVEYQIGEERHVVRSVQLRRMTAADMLITDQPVSYTERLLQIVENMSGLLRPATLKLDAVDIDRIDAVIGYFRLPGSVTGVTS